MRHLDLFSGIGGFALAARRVGWETVAFCEIDPYCQKVLAKHWPDVPIHSDVRELTGDAVGPVDIITGGYPCQPFSYAGERRGSSDDRHLWPDFARLICELRPSYVVAENVAGHISMGLDEVLSDLEGFGYTCRATVVPACAVDAPHRRDRLWIVGHANHEGEPDVPVNAEVAELRPMADSGSSRQPRSRAPRDARNSAAREEGQTTEPWDGGIGPVWSPEPAVGRVAHGIPRRVDRLRALGNAIVPQVAEMIFRSIA